MGDSAPSQRTQIKRAAQRAIYDKNHMYTILDEGLVAHVGLVQDGLPVVIPMGYARKGNDLLLHGSISSRLMKAMKAGTDVCVTVTVLDGLVLARSPFHHSMNYRSVVAFGRPQVISDPQEKDAALEALVEHIIPGRSADGVRPNNKSELISTVIVSLSLDEASAKVRTGPPKDDKEDYELDVWAGELPLQQTVGKPVNDPKLKSGVSVPKYVAEYTRHSTA
ncbi:TPA: hypothetical protein ACH3X2_007734 [Trebouxia sp. C0005]|nr:MAG: hypothetical protein FRX49_08963 [Trebouxia sp. A1-2]